MNQDGAEHPKVLIIDDDSLALELLEARLSEQGYEVTSALSAKEGLAASKQVRHHLVLLDVMMPEMSGFEVCRELNKIHKGEYVPIILLTSMDDTRSKVKGLESGAYDYVTKPFDAQELLARVGAALRTKKLYDELNATREKLTEAERLAALGEMVITLNHEINNPLQAIVLTAENMLSDLPERDPQRKDLEAVIANCDRIKAVMNQITGLKRVRSVPYIEGIHMLDLDESV